MNSEDHLSKAKRNKVFLKKHLLKALKNCPDWASVVAFYSALHFVEAFLKKNHNLDFEHHEERHKFMSQHLREIWNAYYRLYDLGFSARYKSVKDAPTFDDADSVIRFDLVEVEKFVKSRM